MSQIYMTSLYTSVLTTMPIYKKIIHFLQSCTKHLIYLGSISTTLSFNMNVYITKANNSNLDQTKFSFYEFSPCSHTRWYIQNKVLKRQSTFLYTYTAVQRVSQQLRYPHLAWVEKDNISVWSTETQR